MSSTPDQISYAALSDAYITSFQAYAPTDIYIDTPGNHNVSIVEGGSLVDRPIGTFYTVDPDLGDQFSYSFSPDTPSGYDNQFFFIGGIDGDELHTSEVFDYETKNTYKIMVRSTDLGFNYLDQTITINIMNVNEAPTNISQNGGSVDENKPTGTTVSTLSTTDPDSPLTNQTFKYFLPVNMADNNSFSISGNKLKTAAVFNFEARHNYTVRVRSADQEGLYVDKDLPITINDVNDPPKDILLSGTGLEEGKPISSILGTLSSIDEDPNGTFTYSLVEDGVNFPDNAAFQIGEQAGQFVLENKAVFDYETQYSYNIKIRSTDSGGLFFEKSFTISVIDNPPTGFTDSYTLRLGATSGNTMSIEAAESVLANDSDIASPDPLAALHAVLEASPLHAAAFELKPDGSFTYTPVAGYTGNDEFSYRANDGGMDSPPVKVTLSILDGESPFVEWQEPVADNQQYDAYSSNGTITLRVNAEDNISVAYVEFQRWDPVQKNYIKYRVNGSPYEVHLNVLDLYPDWNQIYAMAYDHEGNRSNLPYIWINSHYNLLYMPVIYGGRK